MNQVSYGLPYMGSKSMIADWLIGILPTAEHFYDVMAGGCAVTHRALLSKKWKHIHANDLTDSPLVFVDAVNKRWHDETRWISHEDFDKLRDVDPYIGLCWSFGNNSHKGYLYGVKAEPYMKAWWYAVVFDDWNDFKKLCPELCDAYMNEVKGITDTKIRQLKIREPFERMMKSPGYKAGDNILYQRVESKVKTKHSGILESLLHLRRLQMLECITDIERLSVSQGDYSAIKFQPNSIIYCDPPYRGTSGYRYSDESEAIVFDHERFYEWAEQKSREGYPVFISEYEMPSDRFLCIAERKHNSRLSASTTTAITERLFVPKGQRIIGTIQLTLF